MGSFEAHSDCPPGDCTGVEVGSEPDGTVNIYDLVAILLAFDLPGGPCDVSPECSGDGIVDNDDLDLARNHFGEECGTGIPASSGGGWEEEPWMHDLLAEFGFDNWGEFAVWVPEADLLELQVFLEALIGALDS